MRLLGECFLLTWMWLLGCQGGQVSDNTGTGSETTNGISGITVDADGKPVHEARMALYKKSEYVWDETLSTTTNKKGQWHFDELDSGTYGVEAHYNATRQWIPDLAVFSDSGPEPQMVQLRQVGQLEGILDISAQHVIRAELLNTPYGTTIDSGVFTLTEIPAGQYVLDVSIFNRTDSNQSTITRDSVTITSNQIVDVGAINVSPFPEFAERFVLDDFEDGDHHHNLGHFWWTFDDSESGGNAVITPKTDLAELIVSGGANNSDFGLRAVLDFSKEGARFAGLGLHFYRPEGMAIGCMDLRKLSRLKFWAKGKNCEISVWIANEIISGSEATFVEDTLLTDTWTQFDFSFEPFLEALPEDSLAHWNYAGRFASKLVFILKAVDNNVEADFWLDEVMVE